MATRNSEQDTPREERTGIKKYFDVHGPVFWPAVILIISLITTTLWLGDDANALFSTAQETISSYGGWFLILSVTVFLIFSIYIASSRFGSIRLGGKKATPEFSKLAWFAMLFSAGMGIGIMFWSVAEPIYHLMSPPMAEAETVQAARDAMSISFLHWGFHAWGIYTLVGLSLAFFAFNKGLPLSFRSVFHSLLGDRIHGWMGDVIDIFAVLATLFGLATSLGLGVKQVNAGLAHLFPIADTVTIQVLLILGITLVATGSVILGIDSGVRVLSEINVRIAVGFLLFILAVGPTIFIFDSFLQNVGDYLVKVPRLGLWTESYSGTNWQNDWTVFYWAWWISWSPYVGMFIARISKGRTVREFVLGVLIVPSVITFLWLSAFGGTAVDLQLSGAADIGAAVTDNVATALFVFLEQFPLSNITSMIGILLIMSFFVTSSDSGSLVIDSLTAGGKLDAPVGQRIFWAQTEGAVAAVLLIGGGLSALQTAAVMTGLPFALILLVMCYSLHQGLKEEYRSYQTRAEETEREEYESLLQKLVERHQQKSNK